MSEEIYTFVGHLPRPIHTLVADQEEWVALGVRVDPIHELDLAGTLEEHFDWQPLTAKSIADQCELHPPYGDIQHLPIEAVDVINVLLADPAVQVFLKSTGQTTMTLRREEVVQ